MPLFLTRYSAESAWLANDISMTLAGWPSAAARLIRRPSPSTITLLPPSCPMYSSTNGRRLTAAFDISRSASRLSSRSKWPLLQTIAPSFIASKCSVSMTWRLPVTVTKKSPILAGFAHRHHAEAVHHGFDGLDRIDLGNDDVRAHTAGAHRDAFTAPAVADDDKVFAGEQNVGRADDAVEGRLARAVAVIEESAWSAHR